jgi:hypothetical protein
MNGIHPERCAAHTCERLGEALVQRYELDNDSPNGFNRPSGEWIWLCDQHTREEFA